MGRNSARKDDLLALMILYQRTTVCRKRIIRAKVSLMPGRIHGSIPVKAINVAKQSKSVRSVVHPRQRDRPLMFKGQDEYD